MLANLRALFGVVVDIVLLRRGPEHLPVSQALLFSVIALSTIAATFMGVATGHRAGESLLQAMIGALVMVLWFRFALAMVNKRERFPQTLSALFAVNALFVPILTPIWVTLLPYLEKNDPANPPPSIPLFLGAAIGFWGLLVEIRIVRSAFEIPWFGAILLVFGEFMATVVVASLLFGGAAPST